MCRLFGVVSSADTSVSAALGADIDAFTQLSARHKDGWGIASVPSSGAAPGLSRGTTAAREDAAYARSIADQRADGLIMHFRLASPGTQVQESNLHPFRTTLPGIGAVAFAHNGHFFDVPAVRKLVFAATEARPQGGTDSELYALLVFELMRTLDATHALAQAATMIQDVSDVVALNALLLTPHQLAALQWLDPNPRSDGFAHPPQAELFRMRIRQEASATAIASNEWVPSGAGWDEMPDRQVVSVARTAAHAGAQAGAHSAVRA